MLLPMGTCTSSKKWVPTANNKIGNYDYQEFKFEVIEIRTEEEDA